MVKFSYEKTEGVFVGYDIVMKDSINQIPDRIFPVIEFGYKNQVFSFRGIENLDLDKGEKVSVLFKPDNPQEAKMDSFFGFWFYPLLFWLLGWLVFTAFTFGMFEKDKIFLIGKNKKTDLVKSEKLHRS